MEKSNAIGALHGPLVEGDEPGRAVGARVDAEDGDVLRRDGTAAGAPAPLDDEREAERREARAVDAALIAGCRAGDEGAMRRLYDRHWRRVASLCGRIAGESEAEELTQEVFLKVFRSLDSFRGDAQLSTWIHRMAVNASITHKARSPARRHVLDGEEAIAELPASPSAERDPRLQRRLEGAIAQLPPGYRAVLVLHDVEGLEHEEVAAIMGTTVGTSKSQLHKARAKMRELLGPAAGEGAR